MSDAITRNICRKIMDREGKGHLAGDWSTNLIEQFEILSAATQGATVSNMWDLTGTDTPTCAFATDGGGVTIGTKAADAGADNDVAALWPLSTGAWSVARKADLTRKHRLSSKIKTGASVASYLAQWGFKLTDTAVYKTDADQAFIFFDTDAVDIDPATGFADIAAGMTTWYVLVSKGGSEYVWNSGITVAAATEYDFCIEIGTDGIPKFFINNTIVATPGCPALTTTAALLPHVRVGERVASATKTLTIRQMHYLGK